MGKVQSLHPIDPAPAPFHSQQRATLAALIDAGNIAKRAEGEALAALGRAEQKVKETQTQLKEAQWNVALAKQAHATSAAQSATTGSPLVADRSLKEARAREVEVQDTLDAASVAVVALQAVMVKAQQVAARADEKIADAARAVMAAEVPRLLAEAQASQAQTIARRIALKALVNDLKVSGPGTDGVFHFLKYNTDLPAGIGGVNFQDWDAHPAGAPWKSALAALLNDADEALPE